MRVQDSDCEPRIPSRGAAAGAWLFQESKLKFHFVFRIWLKIEPACCCDPGLRSMLLGYAVTSALAALGCAYTAYISYGAFFSTQVQIDPDAGIVINWDALDKIVENYTAVPPEGWLPPPLNNCSLPEFVAAPPILNLEGFAHEKYRPG